MQTFHAQFTTNHAAESAHRALICSGIAEDNLHLTLLANAAQEPPVEPATGANEEALAGESPGAENAGSSAMTGIAIGSAIGITLGAVATPVAGPFAVMAGAGVGAYAGSLIGALSGMDTAENDLHSPPQDSAVAELSITIMDGDDTAAADGIVRSFGGVLGPARNHH